MTPALELPPPEAAAAHVVPWAVLASGGRWVAARHLRYLGEQLMRVHRGEVLRLVISCPPRHGKSWLVSRYFPSWYLGRHPEHKVILLSMQERFSRRWGRMARDDYARLAEPLWGFKTLTRSSTAEWEVFGPDNRRTEGSMSSIGWNGTITGKGADLILVDDLVRSMKEARNEKLRDEMWETFESAVETRLEPPGRVVVISTRWHHDDLIGRITKKQRDGELGNDWKIINLPAIAEEGDELGRAPGEALWPARISAEFLAKKRKNMAPNIWESLFQGRPTPLEGSILKKIWFRYYELGRRLVTVPERGTCAIDRFEKFATVDLAASKKRRGDFTAIAIWGFHPTWNVLVLLDLVCERLGGDGIIPELKRLREVHKPVNAFYVEREGPLLEEKLGSLLKEAARDGLPIVELRPEGDKEARLIAATGAFASGQVWFPAGASWLASYEEELLTFPEAKHDDRVDVTSYAVAIFNELTANRAQLERERPSGVDPPHPEEADPFFFRGDGPKGDNWF